mgnify:CR=1 FL=1
MRSKSGEKNLIKRFVKDFFFKYWKNELLVFILIIADSIFVLVIPYLNKMLIDNVFTNRQYKYFYIILSSMIVGYLLQLFIRVIKDLIFFKVGEKILVDVRLNLINHVLNLPASFFSKMTSGQLISRVENDVTVLQQVASSAFMEFIGNIIGLIFVLSIMFYLNIKLTLVSLVIMSMYLIMANYFGKHTRQKSKEKLNATSNNISYLSEVFSNIVTIKLFNREAWAYSKFNLLYNIFYNKSIGLWKFQILNMNSTFLLSILATGALWLIGGQALIQGSITLGSLIAFQSYQGQLFAPLRLFSNLNSQIQSATSALERIYTILDEKLEEIDITNSKELKEIDGKIEFKNVSFSYNKSEKVLKNLSFCINPGELVAFVGQSGCGKSTIFNLLTRLYNPQKGSIFIDDLDIKNINLESLRNNISIIPQEIKLFNMSIYENLKLGNSDTSLESIKEYAEKVDMNEYIENLPNKYNAILDENGNNLSGGQKKRLGIVRSLLKESKILIIDEAMNSLDNYRKDKVKEVIKELRGNCTILLISHQLKDLKDVDKIFIVEDGTITDCGEHELLLKHNNVYKELYKKELSQ